MASGLTIVLLGKSGVGKSASGNTVLGRAAFESDPCIASVKKQISEQTGRVFGKQISVVDTPGILNSEETTEKIKSYCKNLLQSNRPCLFLVALSIGQFTEEDQKAVDTAKTVLGDRGLKKSYLLFTNGDRLKNRSLKDFIFAEKEGKLIDAVRMFSGAFHLFNNEDGDQEQVRNLLLKTGYLRDQHPLDPPAAQQEPVQRRIVLLGRPGVGKSASGNTILGSKRFKSARGFNSVSTECVSESVLVDGRLVKVVDTPGFTDEVLNPEQLYEKIMKTLLFASPGPHAFVIVVKIDRISEAEKKLFELLPKLFGGDASKYSMVLFTHGDGLEDQSVDELIQSHKNVSDLVSMCAGRYCVFDNTQREERQQVRELLNKIDEMVETNGGEHCTSDMFRMAETFIREERNRAAQSADSNPSDSSEGVRRAPVKKTAWERLKPYLKHFAVVGGLIGLVAGAAVGGAISGVVLGTAVAVGAGAGAGAVVGAGAGYAIHKSKYKKKQYESSSDDSQKMNSCCRPLKASERKEP